MAKGIGELFRLSDVLQQNLIIGESYSREHVAKLMNREVTAISKGVATVGGSDAFVIFVTLNKQKDMTQYVDMFDENTNLLFWEGPIGQKHSDDYFSNMLSCHVFMRYGKKDKFTYYGRCLPLRKKVNPTKGISSHYVLDLFEWAASRKELLSADAVASKEKEYSVSDNFEHPTEMKKIQNIRIGQQKYRESVIDLWHEKCAVTGVDNTSWLIASHIKPWRDSIDSERLDPRNSLLLTPNYDKLFDAGVISFHPSSGKILLPDDLSDAMKNNLDRLGIDDSKKLREIPEGTESYLQFHQMRVFGYSRDSEIYDSNSFINELFSSYPAFGLCP